MLRMDKENQDINIYQDVKKKQKMGHFVRQRYRSIKFSFLVGVYCEESF
mgnify:CR=1 FL=1